MAAGKWNMQKASGGVASITIADGVSNTAVVLPESGTVATTDNVVGFKNYIINGNFDVWQRGISQTASGYGSDDRWVNNNIGSTKTHSMIDCTDVERALFNASKFSRTVVSSVAGANNYCNKGQSIEDVTRLAGKTVTLSFWAKADANKNIAITSGQTFGTGGSPSAAAYSSGQLVALTTTWQKKTITMTIPSIVGKTLGTGGVNTSATYIYFAFDYGSGITIYPAQAQQSGTFDIAQVQLEEGSVATPFEQRPYGLELSLCQRYYEKVDSDRCNTPIYGTGTGFLGSVKYKVPKRTIPTVSLGIASHWRTIGIYTGTALSTLNVQEITCYGFDVNGTSSGGNITAGYAGKIQVNDVYADNGTDGIFVSAEL